MNILRLEKAKNQKAFRRFIRDFCRKFFIGFPDILHDLSAHFPDGFSAGSGGFLSRFFRGKSTAFFQKPGTQISSFSVRRISIRRTFPRHFSDVFSEILFKAIFLFYPAVMRNRMGVVSLSFPTPSCQSACRPLDSANTRSAFHFSRSNKRQKS
jgi:hypothetical protein